MIKTTVLASIIYVLTATTGYADLIYQLDTPFSGDSSANAAITADFKYITATNVQLTLSAPTALGSEFVGSWYFNYNNPLSSGQTNYNGNTDAANLQVSHVSGVNSSFSVGPNKADGTGGFYAFTLDFAANAFTGGSTSVLDLTLQPGAGTFNSDLSNFNLLSEQSNGQTYFSAAHIQNLSGGESTWVGATASVAAPEPMTYLCLGSLIGLTTLLKLRKKIRKNTV